MIYFDNAATTFYKPPQVISAVTNTIKYLSANPGRGSHSMSNKAGLLVHRARANCAEFFGVENADRIVFTQNCSAALNIAILGSIKKGGHVIATALEHNSVLRPLFELERAGLIKLSIVPPAADGTVHAEDIFAQILPSTYLIALCHVSNVTGAKNNIKQVGKLAKSRNILLLVDAAQSAGYDSVLVDDNFIDMMAIAPHKGLHAVQGVGILALGRTAQLNPVLFGGSGTMSESVYQPRELPEALEVGTMNTPAIAGVNRAIFWNKEHQKSMSEKISELCAYIHEQLSKMQNITLYTPKNCGGGIVSFNVRGFSSEQVSTLLSEEYDICTRSGLHCAPLAHKHYNTLNTGMVRVSPGFESTYVHAKHLITAIQEICT